MYFEPDSAHPPADGFATGFVRKFGEAYHYHLFFRVWGGRIFQRVLTIEPVAPGFSDAFWHPAVDLTEVIRRITPATLDGIHLLSRSSPSAYRGPDNVFRVLYTSGARDSATVMLLAAEPGAFATSHRLGGLIWNATKISADYWR